MSEEHACLVRARSDSENSANLGSFGSMTRTMTYNEDKLNTTEASGEPAAANAINLVISPPDNAGENESGELLDYNDANVLEQFHEDAIRQAGCGFSQIRVVLACSLAIVGASLELSAIPFVLPSAEIELCVLPHERNWLVLISLMGCAFGSVGWGSLSARLGRRRTLLSCLAVNAVFATIAAFMPTYGTFMMARFCSAFGSGGIFPLCYSYMCEMSGRGWARGGAGGAVAAGGAGALLAAVLASAVLPPDGAATLAENREHFSAWHRYLLICTLPILASLISLIWTQESPRYLLDVGREVDAMCVYQAIHSSNQVRICRKANVAATNESEYRLGELSLPGKRRPPALHHVRHSVKMIPYSLTKYGGYSRGGCSQHTLNQAHIESVYISHIKHCFTHNYMHSGRSYFVVNGVSIDDKFWQTFFQLFSSTYISTTLTFILILGFSFTIQFFLAGYVPSSVVGMEHAQYEASTGAIEGATFRRQYYNTTIQNTRYDNTTFTNCSFRDLLMFHVEFWNCSFYDVAMANVKSSRTTFYGCLFVNSTIIDTDLEVGVEFDDWCVFNSTVIRGMKGGCARHADLTSKLSGLISEQTYIAHATFLAALFTPLPDRLRPSLAPCLLMLFLSPLIYVASSETALYIVEAVYRLLVTIVFFGESLRIYQAYPANLRCTAHGFIMSVSFVLAIGAWDSGVSDAGSAAVSAVCVAISATLACAGAERRRRDSR